MKHVVLLLIIAASYNIYSQNIIAVEAVANKTVEVTGNLNQGKKMETLRWAWNSAVACFPETQVQKFIGNHVLYLVDLPRYSEMVATVIPEDRSANFSLYAYEIGQLTEDNLVPNLSSCVRCEADHKWDYKYKGKTQDHTRTVKNLVAINNPYQVVIGVVGANGLNKGGFTLQIKLKSR